MVTLSHGRTRWDYLPVATFDEPAEVWLYLCTAYCSILMYGIYLTIVVKEDREVIYVTLHVDVSPWSLGLVCDKDLHAMAIDVREDIELPVVVSYARSPYTLSVCLTPVHQLELVAETKEVLHGITTELPIDEVTGMENDEPGNAVHGCPCEIVVVAYAYDIRIRELVVE